MFEMIEKNCDYEARIAAIHPDAVPHRKVSISIVGEVNQLINIQEIIMNKEELLLVM